MDRQLILNTLLADASIVNLVSVEGVPQIFLWMTPNQDLFPRIVLRETDDGTNLGADNRSIWSRQSYEIAFTVKATDWATFISLCELIPAAMARIQGRHVSSGADQPIPEHGVVTKSQTFEFYEYEEK